MSVAKGNRAGGPSHPPLGYRAKATRTARDEKEDAGKARIFRRNRACAPRPEPPHPLLLVTPVRPRDGPPPPSPSQDRPPPAAAPAPPPGDARRDRKTRLPALGGAPAPGPGGAAASPAEGQVYQPLAFSRLHPAALDALQWPDRGGDQVGDAAPSTSKAAVKATGARLAALFGVPPGARAPAAGAEPPGRADEAAPPGDAELREMHAAGRGWKYVGGVLVSLMSRTMDGASARRELRTRVEDKHLLLDNPVASLPGGGKAAGGGAGRGPGGRLLSGRQRRARGLAAPGVGEGGARDLHQRWQRYARDLMSRVGDEDKLAREVHRASMVGAAVSVAVSRDPRMVGRRGILVRETPGAWHLAAGPAPRAGGEGSGGGGGAGGGTRRVLCVPKRGSEVAVTVPWSHGRHVSVRLVGDGCLRVPLC